MAKTEKELQELKKKVESLDKELKELSEEELDQVAGGSEEGEAMRRRIHRTFSWSGI